MGKGQRGNTGTTRPGSSGRSAWASLLFQTALTGLWDMLPNDISQLWQQGNSSPRWPPPRISYRVKGCEQKSRSRVAGREFVMAEPTA
jgi:hypothetical protein